MILHQLASAVANLRRSPFATAANVLTLALGLACFIAAYGVAIWWRSADSYHVNAERTVVLGQSLTLRSRPPAAVRPSSSAVAARTLREEFAELRVARVLREPSVAVAAGDAKTFLNAAVAEPEFLEIFDLDFIEGDPRRALAEPGSVVLTEEAARRIVGDAPALGRRITIAGDEEGIVTGVIAPVRQPSFMGASPDATLQFDMLRSWAASERGAEADAEEDWTRSDALDFVLLPPGLAADAFNARLPGFVERRLPSRLREDGGVLTLEAFPLSELTTRELDSALLGGAATGRLTAAAALVGLGLLTLAVACVNYAGLATAQAATRAKEIGTRRVLGGGRAQIMAQAWLETLLLTSAAVAVALAVLALAAPAARAFVGVDMLYFLSLGAAQGGLIAGLIALVALLAGAYPALALSSVRPADALRSRRRTSGSKIPARLLVGVQFASASFLLILLAVTQAQRTHLERTALAPREDPIVILNDLAPVGVDYDTLEARLEGLPGVLSVSVVDKGPWDLNGFNPLPLWPSNDPSARGPIGFMKSVGYDYFETLNIDLIAGRAFERGRDATPTLSLRDLPQPFEVVLDAAFAERIGFASPEAAVDQIVWVPWTDGPFQPARIIGVTETDYSIRLRGVNDSAGEPLIAGVSYVFAPRAPSGGQHPVLRLDREQVPAALAAIGAAWDELAPTAPADIRFYDDLFAASFRAFDRASQLFALLAGAAFAIASIGLLGMAVHATSRRRHEIGVRKTLGSTTIGIVRLLLVDFSKPILAANLLAWPMGWLAAQAFLQPFAERVPLTLAPFVASLAVTLAIAWAAVLGEVWKAASVRPADVLRHA